MEDKKLLKRVRRREEAALGEVFDMFYEPIYRYVYQHVGHAEASDDLTAEVFKRFLESVEKGTGPVEHLRAWLYRVAYNLIVDDSRRQKHRGHLPLLDTLPAAGKPVPEQAEIAIMTEETSLALTELTEKQRSVIILKYIQGLDNTEIAEILDLRPGAVRALSHRGIKAMERSLKERGVL